MWIDNSIYLDDLQSVADDKIIPWERLEGKTVLITGATGLIGSNLVNTLLFNGTNMYKPPKVIALVRNEKRAKQIFAQPIKLGLPISFAIGDISDYPQVNEPVDFIIHGASVTASIEMIKTPVETIKTALKGTEQILEFARRKRVESVVYLSSMEVYGSVPKGTMLYENMVGCFPAENIRNDYPLSKLMCENWCHAYGAEYGVPIKIIRLAQTFGPGVSHDDKRMFADFARCVIEKRNIEIHSAGLTERMYLYTADAVGAILTVLLCGKMNETYNAANETTYMSISEIAHLVAGLNDDGTTKVVIRNEAVAEYGYAATSYFYLNTDKLQKLGWQPKTNLDEMFIRMIASW